MNLLCLKVIFFIEFSLDSAVSYQLHGHEPNAINKNKDTKNTDLLIIDTDAGVDDVAAIMVLLEGEKRNTNGRIVAITTVTGNTDVHNVTENVFKVLDLENRLDIPVFKGTMLGLSGNRQSDKYFGLNGLGDVFIPRPEAKEMDIAAAKAIVDIVDKNPGKVTLVTLGPLTNIAIALSLDNLFLTKLKRWLGMGGSNHGLAFVKPSNPGVETNFFLDSAAAHLVLSSCKKTPNPTTLLPWDPVELMKISVDWRWNNLGKLESKRVKFLNYIESNIEKEDYWIFSDAALALVLIDPTIVTEMSYHAIEVVKEGMFDGGLIVDYHDILTDREKVHIVESLDAEVFKRYLIEYLNAY